VVIWWHQECRYAQNLPRAALLPELRAPPINSLPPKRTSHRPFPGETEISRFELMRVFDGDAAWVRELEESIFCRCPVPAKRLIQYKVFVNDLHDLVLRGLCSGCNTIAARYVETGEDPEKVIPMRHADPSKGRSECLQWYMPCVQTNGREKAKPKSGHIVCHNGMKRIKAVLKERKKG